MSTHDSTRASGAPASTPHLRGAGREPLSPQRVDETVGGDGPPRLGRALPLRPGGVPDEDVWPDPRFRSDDAAADEQRLREAGVPVVGAVRDEPWGQRHFYCADPNGVLIDVVETIPADPAWLSAHGIPTDA